MAFGANHIDTTNLAGFSPALYARTYLERVKKNKPAMQFFTDYTSFFNGEGKGQSIVVPKPSAFTTATFTPTTGLVPQNPLTANATITVDQDKENSIVIPNSVAAKARDQFVAAYIDGMVDAMLDTFDAYLCGLAASFATTVAATTATGDTLWAHFQSARKTLNSSSVPTDNRAWFMGADLETRLLGIDKALSNLYGGGAMVETGNARKLLGADVYLDQNIASATVTTTTDTNFLAHRSAIGYVLALQLTDRGYSIQYQGDVIAVHWLYGASVMDTARGVKLTSTY